MHPARREFSEDNWEALAAGGRTEQASPTQGSRGCAAPREEGRFGSQRSQTSAFDFIHHRLDGHEFEQAPGVGDGQGSLACCSPWGRKELDTTEQLN